MSNIVNFKIESDEISVQYEVITTADISSPMTEERARIMSQLSEIDHCLAENQAIIDKLDAEIHRLTNHADGIDYTIAVASGIISGLIDSFFVGEFSLGNANQWGTEKVESFVIWVSKRKGYKGDTLKGAVGFLEKNFKIPADDATDLFGGGSQHHIRDFSHHPTPIGLIFSLFTQFSGKVVGTDLQGAYIALDVPNKAFIGENLPNKLAIGFTDWFFHMVSDMAGSSGSIGKGENGTGLPGPMFSLLKELSGLPFFSHKKNTNEFCSWVNNTFHSKNNDVKFDLRTEIGIAHELGRQAIPVIINECIVRISYFVRRLIGEFKNKNISNFHDFIHKIDWRNTLPFNNRTIARMMTIASGTFVAVDLADASIRSAIKSGGEPVAFFTNMVLRVNFVGIGRFAVAICTDAYMGYKRGRLRNERMYRQSEQIMLKTAKLYYKEADMWISARDTREALIQMEETATQSIIYFQESLIEIGQNLETIVSYRPSIEINNPKLLDDLSNLLQYGK